MDWLIRFPGNHRILFAFLVLLLVLLAGRLLFWRGKQKRTSRPSLAEALKGLMVGRPVHRTARRAVRTSGLPGDPPLQKCDVDVLPGKGEEHTLRERMGSPNFKGRALADEPRGIVVWFATDRRREASDSVSFSGKRSEAEGGPAAMTYGTAYITLPPGHVTGRIEQRHFWNVLVDENDGYRFIVIHPPQVLSVTRFFSDVAAHVRDSSRKDVLVFVHGYRVGFDDGLKRLAQIAVDLGFEGAPILYSWPSKRRLFGYGVDSATVRWTVPHLETFLTDVIRQTAADRIYLLAHSLGTDALTTVLQLVRRSMGDAVRPLFRHVVLAAPDIDAGTFATVATEITPLAGLVTLYASATDRPLAISGRLLHGYARAGHVRGGLVVAPPMETIDATGLDSTFLRHSYFGSTDPMLSDMHELLFMDARADDRFGLIRRDTDVRGRFWQFAPRSR
jgi:esterase/lipase superfamily enzyme